MNKYGLAYGYKYKILRHDNIFISDNMQNLDKYTIELQFYNNIGILIYSVKLNESDIINIIDTFSLFLCGYNNNSSIKLHLNNNKYPVIELSNIGYNNESELMVDGDLSEYRCYQISIFEVDMNDQNSITLFLKIPMGMTEIEEFIFDLYFNGLSDIVFPDNILNKLDECIGRIFGSNWFNYN